jgi:hypothetical protein
MMLILSIIKKSAGSKTMVGRGWKFKRELIPFPIIWVIETFI